LKPKKERKTVCNNRSDKPSTKKPALVEVWPERGAIRAFLVSKSWGNMPLKQRKKRVERTSLTKWGQKERPGTRTIPEKKKIGNAGIGGVV